MDKKYELIDYIGGGAFGAVYKIENTFTKDVFVVKRIKKHYTYNENKENTNIEIEIMKKLNHPNTIKFIESFETEDELQIIMEYADSQDLEKYINLYRKADKFIPERIVLNFFTQIALGLNHLHGKKMIHRDIKPQNVMVCKKSGTQDEYILKLGDYGVSKILDTSQQICKTYAGTPLYMAPEVRRK